jgi:hypothetical protein
MEAENAEATRFAIPLRTILILLLSNLGKRVLEKSLVRKKTKRFKHRKISFFTLERNWTKLIKAGGQARVSPFRSGARSCKNYGV